MTAYEIQVFHSEEVRAQLGRFSIFLDDLRPFWAKVVPLFVRWTGLQFETRGSFFGTPWPGLSPRYAAWKSLHFPGRSILVARGQLKRAAQSPTRTATATSLRFAITGWDGNPDWHQSGTSRMPARPIYPEGDLPGPARAELTNAGEEYVEDIIRRLNL